MGQVGQAKLLLSGRGADEREDGHKSYNADFLVEFDNTVEGASSALNAYGVPQRKEAYQIAGEPFDNEALVVSRSAKETAPRFFVVSCTWDTNTEPESNPTDDPVKISGSVVAAGSEAVIKDVLTGKHILNAAKQPFEQQPTKDKNQQVFHVSYNTTENPLDWAYLYTNKLNLDAWNGFPAETVKIKGINWDDPVTIRVHGSKLTYWPTTIDFEVDLDDEFKLKAMNIGFKKLEMIEGVLTPVNIKDGKGRDLVEPVPLKPDGTDRLPDGDDPEFLEFTIYNAVDFSPLQINLYA